MSTAIKCNSGFDVSGETLRDKVVVVVKGKTEIDGLEVLDI